MIPIYDDNPTHRFTWVTWGLIALNVAAFGYELSLSAQDLSSLIASRGFVASRFFENPTDPRQLLTLVTAAFLHAGWVHLLGNMLYLWVFGNNVEDRFGHWRFMLFYACSGALAAIAQGALAPTSTIPVIGASGAIAGVLGAYVLLYPRAHVVTLVPVLFLVELAAIPASFVIAFWFVLQLAQGVGTIGAATGVAWWSHIAGFVFGLAVAAPVAIYDVVLSRVRRRRGTAS